MADLLQGFVDAGAARVLRARRREPEAALRFRALDTPSPPGLTFSEAGFDLIGEVKRRSPSAGTLTDAAGSGGDVLVRQARAYERAGAAAVSVLTEPDRFAGNLADLESVSRAVGVPAMRKDFLVSPYQIYETRAAGGAGVLLIQRILDDANAAAMLEASAEAGLWVLLEVFDRDDLRRVAGTVAVAHELGVNLLVGLNSRDLNSLKIDRDRFASLAPDLPAGVPWVAESGLTEVRHARAVAALGYRAMLVGTALMRSADPEGQARSWIAEGRRAIPRRSEGGIR